MIRVLLVDDHRILLEGLAMLLKEERDMDVTGTAIGGNEAVELARRLRPDVVVMDVWMPDMDGIETTRIIKRDLPEVRVIGLSMNKGGDTACRMRDAGAETYLTKGGPTAALIAAIRGEPVPEGGA